MLKRRRLLRLTWCWLKSDIGDLIVAPTSYLKYLLLTCSVSVRVEDQSRTKHKKDLEPFFGLIRFNSKNCCGKWKDLGWNWLSAWSSTIVFWWLWPAIVSPTDHFNLEVIISSYPKKLKDFAKSRDYTMRDGLWNWCRIFDGLTLTAWSQFQRKKKE